MKKYLLPLKKEVWEHYSSMIKMPAILLAVLSVLLLITTLAFSDKVSNSTNLRYDFNLNKTLSHIEENSSDIRKFSFSDEVLDSKENIGHNRSTDLGDRDDLRSGLKMSLQSPYVLFHGTMLLVAFSFLLSCLMSDRKDNSILFWKSMPISETQNVLTKLFVAIALLPVIAWIASFIMSIIIFISSLIFALFSGIDHLPTVILHESTVLETGWEYIGTFLAISLWLLPIAAWFLLASAAAKKNTFLTATLPILIIAVVEKYLFGSHRFVEALFQHMSGLMASDGNSFMLLYPGWGRVGNVLNSSQFWITLPISAALIYAAIWFRENRYEN